MPLGSYWKVPVLPPTVSSLIAFPMSENAGAGMMSGVKDEGKEVVVSESTDKQQAVRQSRGTSSRVGRMSKAQQIGPVSGPVA